MAFLKETWTWKELILGWIAINFWCYGIFLLWYGCLTSFGLLFFYFKKILYLIYIMHCTEFRVTLWLMQHINWEIWSSHHEIDWHATTFLLPSTKWSTLAYNDVFEKIIVNIRISDTSLISSSYLIFVESIEFLMSFNESVNDLNSKEFRSPPSARHWKKFHTNNYVSFLLCTAYIHVYTKNRETWTGWGSHPQEKQLCLIASCKAWKINYYYPNIHKYK